MACTREVAIADHFPEGTAVLSPRRAFRYSVPPCPQGGPRNDDTRGFPPTPSDTVTSRNFHVRRSNPDILNFMALHNMTRTSELHAYFMTKVLLLLGQKSKPIVWQEVFYDGAVLPSDAIIQVWKTIGSKDMIAILAKRHKVIYSSSWYLDQLSNGGDWYNFYVYDPRRIIDSKSLNLEDIVGGEACMWGEVVDDTNFIARVWPRASAPAEVLWSALNPQYTLSNGSQIASRLEEHVCRMNRRGIRAQPANGPSALDTPLFTGIGLRYDVVLVQ
ncbi:unnamed protein product [Spodoptera littoralis]|uniref:beta-N-acetylhexosaminidase n=1 Tax=Spodoptera littoralis TaxID=7109 RepID=A0A9P0MXA7_SPOLI|nr:unnamed protein product [Spodoptera littoralis]CAH1636776.1 unnamed protein product [Spodoptera littoralis]